MNKTETYSRLLVQGYTHLARRPVQLCAGHRLKVTDITSEDEVLCVSETGEDVWIERCFVEVEQPKKAELNHITV